MTEIAIRETGAVVVPATNDTDSWITVVRDIIKIADVIYDTPFVPDGLRGSAPAVAAAMLAGREMGLGIMTSLANIDVIRGKPTQKALLMRAMIQSKGHKWEDVDVSDTRVVVRGCRKGESTWTEASFTADQAKKAGIDLGKYPADKLYARATSRLARRKFADVIMGMPYSAEEAEDGVADEGTITDAAPAAIEAPKPAPAQRTARRRQAAPDASPAHAAPPAAPAAPAQQGAGEALPPLPGEEETPSGAAADAAPDVPDETDYDTAGTVTGPMLTAIWTVLSQVFHFSKDEKEQARMVCAHIVDHDLKSSNELSKNEGKAVLDTLAHWQKQASDKGEDPRDYLIATMAAQDGARGE